jgi:hypothetical protein
MGHGEGRIYVRLGRQSVHPRDCWRQYFLHLNLQAETHGGFFDVYVYDWNCRRHRRHW